MVFSFGLVILEVATNICVPDGGMPWHALRSNDFTVVDLSPLSPALADLITSCMASDPSRRPTVEQMVAHPVIQRARNGSAALAPQERGWLAEILAGSSFDPVTQPHPAQPQQQQHSTGRYTPDGDLIME